VHDHLVVPSHQRRSLEHVTSFHSEQFRQIPAVLQTGQVQIDDLDSGVQVAQQFVLCTVLFTFCVKMQFRCFKDQLINPNLFLLKTFVIVSLRFAFILMLLILYPRVSLDDKMLHEKPR